MKQQIKIQIGDYVRYPHRTNPIANCAGVLTEMRRGEVVMESKLQPGRWWVLPYLAGPGSREPQGPFYPDEIELIEFVV